MSLKKKLLAYILCTMVVISCLSVTSGAITMDLMNGDSQIISNDTISTTQTKLTGKTYKTSGHGIYYTAMYYNSNKKAYVNDVAFLLNYNTDDSAKGYTTKSDTSSSFSSKIKWKLKLNPYRLYNDCRGTGTLVNNAK